MPGPKLNVRAAAIIALLGIVGALVGVATGLYLARTGKPWFRAEMELALLPGPDVPAEEISNYWEALARGQAPRIAAEVLDQPRWAAGAAQAAGVEEGAVLITAGVVTDTTLITVGGEAPSAEAAEAAVTAAVTEATPLAQSVSGPFVLQVVQPAQGTAVSQTTPDSQVVAVAGVAGLVVGAGAAVLFVRRRGSTTGAAAPTPRPGGGQSGGGLRPGPAPQRPPAPHRQDGPPGRPPVGLRPGAAPLSPHQRP
jgi:xanthosine utilization system XapX-like protein